MFDKKNIMNLMTLTNFIGLMFSFNKKLKNSQLLAPFKKYKKIPNFWQWVYIWFGCYINICIIQYSMIPCTVTSAI